MSQPTTIELTDFQRFLTIHKGFTTIEAIELCKGGDHEAYLKLWSEFEVNSKSEKGN